MRFRRVFNLLKMQARTSMRDRRTFWTMVLVPLLMMPVLVLVMPLLMAKITSAVKLDRLAVAIEGNVPAALSAELSGGILHPLKLTPVENAEKAGSKFVVALRIPAAIPQAIGAEEATLQIFVDRADKRSAATVLLIEAAVARYNQGLLSTKLTALGISPSAMSPLKTHTISAKPGELGFNLLGMILPILLSIWTLVGGQATAIDATVGERERATLEALLAAPITRTEVVQIFIRAAVRP
jgi:sodium transport system permease protein